MKTLLAALAGVSLLAIGTAASAEIYYTAGYTHFSADDVGAPPQDAGIGAITGRAGWTNDSWFGVEAEGSVGVVGDTVGGVDVDLNYSAGAFARVQLPINDSFRVFARAGYVLSNLDIGGASDGQGGAAYGVGAQYNMGQHGFRGDFTQYDLGSIAEEVNSFSLSYVYTPGYAPLESYNFGGEAAGLYGSVGYSMLDVGTVELGAVTARAGWDSGNILGVEVEGSMGVQDDTVALPAPARDVSLDYQVAIFAVAKVSISESFDIFARAGYGKTELDTAGLPGLDAEDDGGVYGAGAQYNFGANAIRVDYTVWGTDRDALSLSYARKF